MSAITTNAQPRSLPLRWTRSIHLSTALTSALAVGLAIYALYVVTMFPGVGGRINAGDSAKFQFLGNIAGVGHPPGNPLYLVVLVAARKIFFFVEPRVVAAQCSAIFAAAGLALLFDALRRYQGALRAAIAVVCVATGPLFWTLATEAEVYTLNVLLLGVAVNGLARWHEQHHDRSLAIALAAFVLAFANHGSIVGALPALIAVAWMVHRRSGIRRYLWAVGAVTSLVVLAIFLYIPFRARSAAYSELAPGFTRKELWEFLRAKQFAGSFNMPTLTALVETRMPEVGRRLGAQWWWPQLLLIGIGVHRALHRARPVAVFCLLAAAGFVTFTVVYSIPDAEGFYVPTAFVLGGFIAFSSDVRSGAKGLIAPALAVALMVPAATQHLRNHARLLGGELVQDTEGRPILWDLPDVVHRLAPGARFVLPCVHYGCVETFNYFRFADMRAREKELEFVQLEGGMITTIGSPPRTIRAGDAATVETCTIREGDAKLMQSAGVAVRRIDRPDRAVGTLWRSGVPIYCSIPRSPR